MSENPKQWRNMEIYCPVCGSSPVSIYTKSDKDNFGYEDEEMQCSECGGKGCWSEGTLGWHMEVPNEEILTVFYEKNEALKAKVAELEAENLYMRSALKYIAYEKIRDRSYEDGYRLCVSQAIEALKGGE